MAGFTTTKDHEPPRASAQRPSPCGPLLFRLLCSDDLTEGSRRLSLASVRQVSIGRGEPGAPGDSAGELRLPLRDPYASGRQTRLLLSSQQWLVSDEGSRNGTLVNGERLGPGEARALREGDLIEAGHTFFLFRAGAQGTRESERLPGPEEDSAEPPTLCPEWEVELWRAERLARTGHELLIQGETGTGKEVLAQRIHRASGRSGPLVALNCAALPENLLEDELFGHVKGAFSGAHSDRQGLFRAAEGGTLLLDEVGDMPAGLQAKLLRAIETHQVRPLGSEKELEIDVRVIAATHHDLRELVARGRFREDLLARLGLLPLQIPALRKRREDLGLLVRAVLRSLPRGLERIRFELEALREIFLRPWPLNVRELRRTLLAAVDLAAAPSSDEVLIGLHHLPQPQPAQDSEAPHAAVSRPPLSPEQQQLELRLRELLGKHRGNVAAVAREMGKPRTHVQRLLARFGIDRRVPR